MASEPADPGDREQATERPEAGGARDVAESVRRDTSPESTPGDPDAVPTTPRSVLPPIESEEISIDVTSDPQTERRDARTRVAIQRRSGEDTLLSLPTPADGEEIPNHEPRLAELERRLQALEARLSVLEVSGGGIETGGRRWLIWIAFMVTLAVVWQMVRHYR